jgi:Tol biopolymer transport system component
MKRRPRSAVLITLFAALVVSGCGGGTVEPRPDLVFVSTRDGDYALYEMNADGGGQTRLTEGEQGTSASPQGLFFQIDPAWSPDGRRLAFASKRAGSFDLYVMNADSTGTRRLTTTKDDDARPTWSPDGGRIAFARTGDIYVMNADGSGAQRISDETVEEAEPVWSPDGRWIAYVRRTPGTEIREIWLLRPDGSDRRQLTALETAIYSPAWSPDSTRIAFSTDNRITQFDIYVVTVAAGKTGRITATPDDSFEPAWSPDGKTIAFSEGGAIYAIAAGNGAAAGAAKITDPDNNDSSPAWNPVPPAPTEEE